MTSTTDGRCGNSIRTEISDEVSSMSFEEIIKLKQTLGSKVYQEAVLNIDNVSNENRFLKRGNKNRPREESTKRQVPFLGAELRNPIENESKFRDPRFDEKCGEYSTKNFKDNYKFISKIRQKEVIQLRNHIDKEREVSKRAELKIEMLKLNNKNVEDRNWHAKQKQKSLDEQNKNKLRLEGRQSHFLSKKERRTQNLVNKFELLKKTGKLNKHLEKRAKKNAAKDRKKIKLD